MGRQGGIGEGMVSAGLQERGGCQAFCLQLSIASHSTSAAAPPSTRTSTRQHSVGAHSRGLLSSSRRLGGGHSLSSAAARSPLCMKKSCMRREEWAPGCGLLYGGFSAADFQTPAVPGSSSSAGWHASATTIPSTQRHPHTSQQTPITHLQEVLLYVCLQAGQPQVQSHSQHCAWVAVQHVVLQEACARLQRRCHLQQERGGRQAGRQ